jgi:hypothetical protein
LASAQQVHVPLEICRHCLQHDGLRGSRLVAEGMEKRIGFSARPISAPMSYSVSRGICRSSIMEFLCGAELPWSARF